MKESLYLLRLLILNVSLLILLNSQCASAFLNLYLKKGQTSEGAAPKNTDPILCETVRNTQPIFTREPRFVRQVENAKLYVLDSVDPPIRVLHVWGTPYERGFAQGQILADELKLFISETFDYGASQLVTSVFKNTTSIIGEKVAKKLALQLIYDSLKMTYELTKDFTPRHFSEEILGLADGSGIDLKLITMLNQIPEMMKASCAFLGAWGDAIANNGEQSTLFQLRALDWAIDGPFNDFPLIIIYHPQKFGATGAHPFATVGYPGFIGTVTGYSSAKVGLSEKLSDPHRWGGTTSRIGIPFHYLFRDILEFDGDVSAAMTRIYNAKRTVAVWVGLGDNSTNQFRAVAYGHDYAYEFSDFTYPWDYISPPIPHVIYNGISDGPDNLSCFFFNIRNSYGRLNAQEIINITAADGTGQTHVAIYDFARDYMYVAYTSSNKKQPIQIASVRPFCRLDMSRMWAEKAPVIRDANHELAYILEGDN